MPDLDRLVASTGMRAINAPLASWDHGTVVTILVPALLALYLARSIDNSTVHLVLRGSTAGSVQKAS